MKKDIITQKQLRIDLIRYTHTHDLSLRGLSEKCGISFSTLSRFLRYSSLGSKLTEKLFYFLTEGIVLKHKPIVTKRIRCDNKEFLITIERIDA